MNSFRSGIEYHSCSMSHRLQPTAMLRLTRNTVTTSRLSISLDWINLGGGTVTLTAVLCLVDECISPQIWCKSGGLYTTDTLANGQALLFIRSLQHSHHNHRAFHCLHSRCTLAEKAQNHCSLYSHHTNDGQVQTCLQQPQNLHSIHSSNHATIGVKQSWVI